MLFGANDEKTHVPSAERHGSAQWVGQRRRHFPRLFPTGTNTAEGSERPDMRLSR